MDSTTSLGNSSRKDKAGVLADLQTGIALLLSGFELLMKLRVSLPGRALPSRRNPSGTSGGGSARRCQGSDQPRKGVLALHQWQRNASPAKLLDGIQEECLCQRREHQVPGHKGRRCRRSSLVLQTDLLHSFVRSCRACSAPRPPSRDRMAPIHW